MAEIHPTSQIILLSGDVCVLDCEDAVRLSAWRWSIHDGYAARRYMDEGRLVRVFMHRAILTTPTGMTVDHVNRNRLDNRRCNLRVVPVWLNAQNCRRGVSGFRGVTFHRQTGKWNARIRVDGKSISLGVFTTIEEAASARIRAEDVYCRAGDPSGVYPSSLAAIRRRSGNKSGHIGVSFNIGRGKWEAWVTSSGKKIHLGLFNTIDAAVAARSAAEEKRPWLAVLEAQK